MNLLVEFRTRRGGDQDTALIVEHQGRDLIVQEHLHRRTPIVAATPVLLEIVKQIRDQK